MNDVLAEAFPFDIFECRHCETIVISGPGSGARLRLASCCSSLAVNHGADRRGALQMHAAIAEAHACCLQRLNCAAEHLVLRRNDALAGDLPGAQHIARQASADGQVVACESCQGTASAEQVSGELGNHVAKFSSMERETSI